MKGAEGRRIVCPVDGPAGVQNGPGFVPIEHGLGRGPIRGVQFTLADHDVVEPAMGADCRQLAPEAVLGLREKKWLSGPSGGRGRQAWMIAVFLTPPPAFVVQHGMVEAAGSRKRAGGLPDRRQSGKGSPHVENAWFIEAGSRSRKGAPVARAGQRPNRHGADVRAPCLQLGSSLPHVAQPTQLLLA